MTKAPPEKILTLDVINYFMNTPTFTKIWSKLLYVSTIAIPITRRSKRDSSLSGLLRNPRLNVGMNG